VDIIRWKKPWRAVYETPLNDEVLSLQRALEQELSALHPLFDKAPRIIGRSTASDDVVASLNDGSFAFVHLTWQGKQDQYPEKFPSWSRIPSIEHLNAYIEQDSHEYEDDEEEELLWPLKEENIATRIYFRLCEDLQEWDENAALAAAKDDGITLTPQHWSIIKAFRGFYMEYQHIPVKRHYVKILSELGIAVELNDLFPGGLNQVCFIAGLPFG
jgi:dissimilatory sulfite reductase related protein